MKTAVGAPAPEPTPDDILEAIDKMTILELRDIGRHLDDLVAAKGGHIHAYRHDVDDQYVCRCGDWIRLSA